MNWSTPLVPPHLFRVFYGMNTNHTFSKAEKLCSKISIDLLFQSGESFVVYPYRIVYKELPEEIEQDSPAAMFVSVAKKRFKRAVKRNLLRRRTKEAYRLNKGELLSVLTQENKRLAIAILYLEREIKPYSYLDGKMKEMLKQLATKIST